MAACIYTMKTVQTPPLVVLIDQSRLGGRSITNAAEEVIAQVSRLVPDLAKRRVIYRDSDGVFDELLLDAHGRFAGFGAIRARTEQGAIDDIAKGRV
jgi:hypothetical protein